MTLGKSMASLINPTCHLESYLLDEKQATMCGKLQGTIFGVVIGIIVAVLVWQQLSMPTVGKTILVVVTALLIVVVCRFLGGFIGVRQQQSSEADIQARMRRGNMTREKAMEEIQKLKVAEKTANATATAGFAVADALLMRR